MWKDFELQERPVCPVYDSSCNLRKRVWSGSLGKWAILCEKNSILVLEVKGTSDEVVHTARYQIRDLLV